MKILKIFGIVVGIHLAALILIFANPGCSSTTKPVPRPSDTVASAEGSPVISVPTMAAAPIGPATAEVPTDYVAPTPVGFNPDAPAVASGSSSVGVRFTPTRPNTPAASAVLAQPPENVTPATTYTVKPGDSLWTLQKRFHVSIKDIAAANNLRSNSTIREGQKLIIPARSSGASSSKASAASKEPASASTYSAPRSEPATVSRPTSEEFKYTVKPGETLGTIARKFDVRTRDLAVANNISDPKNLRAGSELTIPGWKSAASKQASEASSAPRSTPAAAPAQAEPPPPNLLDQPSAEPSPAPSGSVPVIDIDENPEGPAPKS